MVYETEEQGFPRLLTPDSVWGNQPHHEEADFGDTTHNIHIAVASLCQDALYNQT